MINRVILVGNLTRDTETGSGTQTPVARMRLATNSVYTDAAGERQERSEFHNVVAFGRLAEICSLYCVRGRRIYIEGKLRTREYAGTDGLRRWRTEVIADTMKLLDRAPGAGHADAGSPAAEAEDFTDQGVDDAAAAASDADEAPPLTVVGAGRRSHSAAAAE
jgi:single-strand DNA-binding protein